MSSKAVVEVQYRASEEGPSLEEKGRDGHTDQAHIPDEDSAVLGHDSQQDFQAGVQKALVLKKVWSRTTLVLAFARCVTSHPPAGRYSPSNPKEYPQSFHHYLDHHLLRLLRHGGGAICHQLIQDTLCYECRACGGKHHAHHRIPSCCKTQRCK